MQSGLSIRTKKDAYKKKKLFRTLVNKETTTTTAMVIIKGDPMTVTRYPYW